MIVARAFAALAVLALATPALPCPAGNKAATTTAGNEREASTPVAKADKDSSKEQKGQKAAASEKERQERKVAARN